MQLSQDMRHRHQSCFSLRSHHTTHAPRPSVNGYKMLLVSLEVRKCKETAPFFFCQNSTPTLNGETKNTLHKRVIRYSFQKRAFLLSNHCEIRATLLS